MKNDIIIFSRISEKTDYTKLSDEEWQNLEVIDIVTKLVVLNSLFSLFHQSSVFSLMTGGTVI
jgi:hypothetical protein